MCIIIDTRKYDIYLSRNEFIKKFILTYTGLSQNSKFLELNRCYND